MRKAIQVHRFGEFVAVSLPGKGETCYVPADVAAVLADAIRECAADVEARKFTDSAFSTRLVDLPNGGSRFA